MACESPVPPNPKTTKIGVKISARFVRQTALSHMLQPFLPKSSGLLLIRLVSCIIIEVEKREFAKAAKLEVPEWQLVIGKRGRQGHGDELSSAARRFPVVCANRFAALNIDEEESFSAKSDEEQPSATSSAKVEKKHQKRFLVYQRRVGLGGTRSSLLSIAVETACDAFLERIRVDQPGEFERRGLSGGQFLRVLCDRQTTNLLPEHLA
eukprot:3431028-Amphidinium_carterae.1